MKTKIALGSWNYIFGPYADKPISIEKTLEKLSTSGYDGVELCGFKPHIHPTLYPSKESREDLKALLESRRLGVSGGAPDFTAVPPVSAPAEDYKKVFRELATLAGDLGMPKLRVDTVSAPDIVQGAERKEVFKKLADLWRECAKMAADAGVMLAWEFEPGFLFNKPSEILGLISQVNHDNFTALFDSSHAQMCAVVGARQYGEKETLPGGVLEFIQKLAGKIGHMHLIDSDNTLHGDETSRHAPFGDGVLNFDEIVPALLKAGYDDQWWVVDLCFEPNAWELTDDSKRFMDQLRDKYGAN
jgi:sugar phosphate isomerase/epimerase